MKKKPIKAVKAWAVFRNDTGMIQQTLMDNLKGLKLQVYDRREAAKSVCEGMPLFKVVRVLITPLNK